MTRLRLKEVKAESMTEWMRLSGAAEAEAEAENAMTKYVTQGWRLDEECAAFTRQWTSSMAVTRLNSSEDGKRNNNSEALSLDRPQPS